MAALRAGVHTVIIPADNEADLEEIDQTVRSRLRFVPTDHVDKVLDVALARESAENVICPPQAARGAEPSRVRQ